MIGRDKEWSRGALSVVLCFALTLLALAAPSARAEAAAVPLIVDTDMFSDADDAGALATAFALQYRREANVIAVAVNTRTSRPAVSTDSWKCVAAITSFYGSPSVPVGTSMPNNGTATGAGFIGPCAQDGPPSPPAPDSAVGVYRRALAAAADGSVVIASVGYLGNLSALLSSGPDATSPLSGRALVAAKVKSLVAMAGGYPSRNGETNLSGDAASAQDVADNWPTKIVWSGFEVGSAVFTGQTISGTHPPGSPVRSAYQAFAGAGTAIASWDLTAVYHAVRPDDPLLRETGPGTNAVSATGANTFTTGTGNQYYLTLSSASSLEKAIEALLDTLHPLPPPPPPPETSPPPPPPPSPSPRTDPQPPGAEAQTTPPPIVAAAGLLTSRFSVSGTRTYRGSVTIRTPAAWRYQRSGRFAVSPSPGCNVTIVLGARGVATSRTATAQVLASSSRIAGTLPFGSGRRAGAAWAVGYSPVTVVRGRAAVRMAQRRYLQILADAILGDGCSDADAKAVAPGLRALLRTADTSRVGLARGVRLGR